MKCSICHEEIPVVGAWATGNNAFPVNDGRCCDECNTSVVIPARLQEFREREKRPAVKKNQWHDDDERAMCGQEPLYSAEYRKRIEDMALEMANLLLESVPVLRVAAKDYPPHELCENDAAELADRIDKVCQRIMDFKKP